MPVSGTALFLQRRDGMSKKLLFICACIFCAATAAAQNVKFISGGVSDDSAERMAAIGKEFNFKLLFTAKDGHYLADVAISISDAANRKVLETVSEGPFLFAQLAPGKYAIAATYAGVTQTRSTTIAARGRRELVFRWEEPAESPPPAADAKPQ
jgi:hypothetical protein